jgi:hypothetical protein
MTPVLPAQVAEMVVRRRAQPRNILGFLFGVTTVIFTGCVVVCVAAIDSELDWLVLPLMILAVVIAVGVMAGVFFRAGTDPAGLMLTQVTGPEYESIQRLTLGSSTEGERVELVHGPSDILAGSAKEISGDDERQFKAAKDGTDS